MVHQLVIGRAQQLVAGVLAQPRAVNQALRVFNAETHREGFGFHVDAAFVQHADGVARTVAQRQHHVVGAQLVIGSIVQVLHGEAAHLPIFDQHVTHALLKPHLAAQRDDLFAHVFHHLDQFEGADMRFADQQNFGWCASLDELGHDLAAQMARVLDLAVKLAVGKGAGAAFTKLHIGFGVQNLFAPQAPGVLGAFADLFAALQDDGFKPHLCQQQGRKNSAGAKTNHHGPHGRRGIGMGHRVVVLVRRGPDVRVGFELLEQTRFQFGEDNCTSTM